MIKTNLFLNDINNSNCYIVQDQKNSKCIVIDPGSRDISFILEFLEKEKLILDYIILTHSHFDHIAGVDPLVRERPASIVSSALCSEKIVDPVKNLSYFSDIGIIAAPGADLIIEELVDGKIKWNDVTIFCFLSPGHSLCSICIQIDDKLFTGDTVIKGNKTKITYPDGNRDELNVTLKHLFSSIPKNTIIFPGHGESFVLGTQDISVSMNK